MPLYGSISKDPGKIEPDREASVFRVPRVSDIRFKRRYSLGPMQGLIECSVFGTEVDIGLGGRELWFRAGMF